MNELQKIEDKISELEKQLNKFDLTKMKYTVENYEKMRESVLSKIINYEKLTKKAKIDYEKVKDTVFKLNAELDQLKESREELRKRLDEEKDKETYGLLSFYNFTDLYTKYEKDYHINTWPILQDNELIIKEKYYGCVSGSNSLGMICIHKKSRDLIIIRLSSNGKDIEEISYDDFRYFRVNGEKEKEFHIRGGEVRGGDYSVSKAALGYAVAGPMGAIIGGKNKIQSTGIESYYTEDDNRFIEIFYETYPITKNEKFYKAELDRFYFNIDFMYKILKIHYKEKDYEHITSQLNTIQIKTRYEEAMSFLESLKPKLQECVNEAITCIKEYKFSITNQTYKTYLNRLKNQLKADLADAFDKLFKDTREYYYDEVYFYMKYKIDIIPWLKAKLISLVSVNIDSMCCDFFIKIVHKSKILPEIKDLEEDGNELLMMDFFSDQYTESKPSNMKLEHIPCDKVIEKEEIVKQYQNCKQYVMDNDLEEILMGFLGKTDYIIDRIISDEKYITEKYNEYVSKNQGYIDYILENEVKGNYDYTNGYKYTRVLL